MALDFPASPSVGQVFTSGNQSWLWDGTKWSAAGSTVNVYKPNKLINPFMEIDQRNEGAAVTVGTGAYAVDGLLTTVSNAGTLVWNTQRVGDAPPGYVYGVRATVTTAGTMAANTTAGFQWRLEGSDIEDTRFGSTGANSLSIAFWVKSSIAGVYSCSLLGAASGRSYCFPLNITTANTWQLISQTIPGDVSGTWTLFGNAVQLYVNIYMALGSSFVGVANTWQATNLPAVPGMVSSWITTVGATFTVGPCALWVSPSPQPLLRTSIQQELARCQRYYEKSYDLGTALGAVNVTSGQSTSGLGGAASATYSAINTVAFAVNKRTAPTITMYSPVTGASGHIRDYNSNADITATLATGVGTHSFPWLGTNSAASGGFNLGVHFFADASL